MSARVDFLPLELASTNFYVIGRARAFAVASAPVGCPVCHVAHMLFIVEPTQYTCLLCATGF
jgi:hypothetical protein